MATRAVARSFTFIDDGDGVLKLSICLDPAIKIENGHVYVTVSTNQEALAFEQLAIRAAAKMREPYPKEEVFCDNIPG